MFEEIFRRKKLNADKLLAFGFKEENGTYRYATDILSGGFALIVQIHPTGAVDTHLLERDTGEEYVLYKTDAAGSFVGNVRNAVESVLLDVAENCFDCAVFKSEQAQFIIDYVHQKYGDDLEFLWKKFPDNAVWRRKDNKKWYGAILTVPKDRLGFSSSDLIEIIDLRIQPEQMDTLLSREHFYPGWHMNKKHWYTVCLDGSISNRELCERIDASYQIAEKR